MASKVKTLEKEVSSWPDVSVGSHQFGAREFRFRGAEIGHVHLWGDVDIPFPRGIRDVLIADQAAQPHRWVPDSGWTTFHMSKEADVGHALWLMRLSYLRHALRVGPDSHAVLRQEAAQMHLDDRLTTLLARHVPANAVAC